MPIRNGDDDQAPMPFCWAGLASALWLTVAAMWRHRSELRQHF